MLDIPNSVDGSHKGLSKYIDFTLAFVCSTCWYPQLKKILY